MKEITIGRSESCDIALPASCDLVSRNHASIIFEYGHIVFKDHSTNGSKVNGVTVHNQSVQIKDGDPIVLPGDITVSWNSIRSFMPSSESETKVAGGSAGAHLSSLQNYDTNKKADGFNLFSFSGRCGRSAWWIVSIVVNILAFIIAALSDVANEVLVLVIMVVYFVAIWAMWATNARRCHDLGHSGWFQLIPFYALWMAFIEGQKYDNEYGPYN